MSVGLRAQAATNGRRPTGPYTWLPALIGFVALAGLTIGYVGLATLSDRLIASAGRTLALTAAESVDQLDLILAEHARNLRTLARDVAIAASDDLAPSTRLAAFAGDHPEFRWLAVTDLSGRVLAASDPARVGTTVGASASIAIARDFDMRTLRSADPSRIGTTLLAFTVPLFAPSGRLRGALIATTSLARVKRVFDRSIRNLRRKWDGNATVDWHLVSPNGDLVASTNRRAALGKLALPSAFASAAAAPGYLEERDPNRDVTVLTGYARMHGRSFPGAPRWALLVHVDRRDVVSPIRAMIVRLGALWLSVTAPLLLLAIWATARLAREWAEGRDESLRALAARRAADASEARMRAVLDHAAEGIVAVDGDGRIECFNAAAARMFGVMPEEVHGISIARLLPSGAGGRHDRTVARWLQRSVVRGRGTIELVAHRRGGAAFPLGLSLSQVTTDAHRGFVGIIRDLTEQKQAESDRGLLASIIEHADDFVSLTNLDGDVLFVNPAGRRLIGMAPLAALRELSLDDFVFPDDRMLFHAVAVPAVLEHGRWQGELRGRHLLTGEPLAVAVNLFLVSHGETGRTTGFAAVCRDIREQKRIESERQRARELTLAKEMAESASLAKSEFLAVMSHEMRTPLNGVVGMTALILDTRLNDEQREYVESLRTCSVSLLGVIDDVLDFSRMEAGKLELEMIDFDLRRTVEEIVELFAERAHRKGLELAALIDPTMPTALRGDPNRLRQILTNLLGNALKFTERGEVVVRVRAVGDGPTHTTVELAVTDSGIGIPPERQAMIFESFSQSDVANARIYGGSGLGLAIVKRLTELMDGQIVVDSEPGAGSTFTLVLRLAKHADAVRAPAPALPFAGRRVLVVDDSPTVRDVMRAYLGALGLRCTCSEDGLHALKLLQAAATRGRPYDAMLLDWDMPAMDGVEVATAVVRQPDVAGVPIVLLTALGQRSAAKRAARHGGIAAYLSKPIRLDRLAACMHTLLVGEVPRRDRRRRTKVDVPRARRGARILVAEDDPTSQKVVRRLLEKRGHRVDVVGDGRSAVEACIRRDYDLVLMDCRLPIVDGFTATSEIRRREPSTRRTPIVALTASLTPERRQRCLDVGMDGHLGKPIHLNELDAVLASWLSARPAPTPIHEPDVLDASGLLDRVDGDLGFVRELLTGLRRDGARWLGDLQAALARHDRTEIEQIAHAIRGSTSNLGGLRAAATAARLEADAHAGSVAEGARRCAEIAAEIDALLTALDALAADRLAAS